MAKKPKPLTVQLVGGLGNQLFGYFAGKYLASNLGCDVKFDISQQDKGFSAHGSSLSSFDLPEEFSNFDKGLFSPIRLAQRVSEILVYRLPLLRPLHVRFFKSFTSTTVGFDRELDSVKPGSFVRGYFQSYVYVDAVVRTAGFKTLELAGPSDWFQKMALRAKDVKPIMVHVRRGDYAKLAEEFGLLSASYYLEGIKLVTEKLAKPAPVWIFSDELENVKNELEPALKSSNINNAIVWVSEPEGTDAAESLMLMSLGCANVISNSTFSWWSAILNPQGLVVAPTKWFKGKEDPKDLIPESWMKSPSIWK